MSVDDDWRIPVHARVAGVLQALAGLFLALAAIQPTPLTRTQAYVVWLVALIGAMVVGGIVLAICGACWRREPGSGCSVASELIPVP
jgi:hypothetical protein